ncbi:MAG: hypothetical protein VX699_04460 [Myxococcota bacterium]|nr:hypothetical protein [Myxococcota bacterium]
MLKRLVLCLVAVGTLTSCEAPTQDELNERWGTVPRTSTVVEFDPSAALPVLPYPVDLLFLGSADGTMNLPVANAQNYADPMVQLNTLDGFSTLTPIDATFSGLIEPLTLIAGDTVRVFEVTKSAPYLAISGIVRELKGDVEFSVELTSRVVANEERHGLRVIPTFPLGAGTSYMVVVGTGIEDVQGYPIEPSLIYGISKGGSPLVDRFGHTTVPMAFGDEQAALLEQLRALTYSYEILLGLQAGIGSGEVALAWTFTTQSVDTMLDALASTNDAGGFVVSPVVDATQVQVTTAAAGLSGSADIHFGALEVPYYLDSENPARSDNFWRGLGEAFPTQHYYELSGQGPVARSTQTIPFLVTTPNATSKPAGGWPVTIFQHDFTQNRFNALAISEALAAAGQAVIAIDLPLHGVSKYNLYDPLTGAAGKSSGLNALYRFSADAPAAFEACGACAEGQSPDATCGETCGVGRCKAMVGSVYANHPAFGAVAEMLAERMMGVDGDGDGEVDGSGTGFLNVQGGLNFRDNLRQAAADLMVLRKTLPKMDLFDTTKVSFVGHGVGASVGVLFLSQAEKAGLGITSAVLASPLSGIARALEASASIGPGLKLALVALAGLEVGSPAYESFFMALQTTLDAADPVNYGSALVVPTLMFEVIGDGDTFPEDTVFPVSFSAEAPNMGSASLAIEMGLKGVSSSVADTEGLLASVRFTKGAHGSLLDPTGAGVCVPLACDADAAAQAAYGECVGPAAAVTTEMQTQLVSFIATGGTTLPVQQSVEINGTLTEIIAAAP